MNEEPTSKELTSKDKYVYISALNRYSSVYDILIGTMVQINNEVRPIETILIGDTVTFEYKSGGNKMVTLEKVVFIDYSAYPVTCIAPDCVVQKHDGLEIVANIVVGDIINTPQGFCMVEYVLKTELENPIPMMVNSKGFAITEYHPIRNGSDQWIFPINDSSLETKLQSYDAVYSFGMRNCSSFFVNNIEVISLGHGIQNDRVATHSYFGTDKVKADILSINNSGYCVIRPEQIVRDPDNNQVCGIKKSH